MWRAYRRIWPTGLLLLCGCAPDEPSPADADRQVLWQIEATDSIGQWPVRVLGSPHVIDDPDGRAVEFDGVDDGLQVPNHPLAGAGEFTAEVIFRPRVGGARQQRFLHLQEGGSKDRILFEIRLTEDDHWFLDTYIKSGGRGYTLFARRFEHPVGPWYHAALVVGGGEMRHYVDGELELSKPIEFAPQGPGDTSIGVRRNRVSWFKGAIREVRFTRRVLGTEEFSR